ncbi:hypothetical protein OKW26_004332 [Paraburkholderia sp. 32]
MKRACFRVCLSASDTAKVGPVACASCARAESAVFTGWTRRSNVRGCFHQTCAAQFTVSHGPVPRRGARLTARRDACAVPRQTRVCSMRPASRSSLRRSSHAPDVLRRNVIAQCGCATRQGRALLGVARLEPAMPYVSQTQHVDRVRGAIEGRLPAPANSSRLVSSWQRSYEQYRLDPSSVIGPRVLTSAFPD